MADESQDCEIGRTLDVLHDWLHLCLREFNEEQLAAAHQLSDHLLKVLNDGPGGDKSDGIKILALYEVIASGIESMEEVMAAKKQWGTSNTIH